MTILLWNWWMSDSIKISFLKHIQMQLNVAIFLLSFEKQAFFVRVFCIYSWKFPLIWKRSSPMLKQYLHTRFPISFLCWFFFSRLLYPYYKITHMHKVISTRLICNEWIREEKKTENNEIKSNHWTTRIWICEALRFLFLLGFG